MLNDPQSITISGTATSLPRVSMGNMKSVYRSADGTLELSVAHSVSSQKRERSYIRLDTNKVGADPFDASRQRNYSASAWIVIDAPNNGIGFTDAELENHVKGLLGFLNGAGVLAKLLGKES